MSWKRNYNLFSVGNIQPPHIIIYNQWTVENEQLLDLWTIVFPRCEFFVRKIHAFRVIIVNIDNIDRKFLVYFTFVRYNRDNDSVNIIVMWTFEAELWLVSLNTEYSEFWSYWCIIFPLFSIFEFWQSSKRVPTCQIVSSLSLCV